MVQLCYAQAENYLVQHKNLLEDELVAITEKIKGIVDFLTQGLEQRDDVFENMMDEVDDDYQTDDF